MTERLKRWLPPLLTLLLIGAGAAMPWAAARFQDRYAVAAREVRPLDAVSLTFRKESEIGSVLRLMGNVYEQTEWPGKTRLTAEEACQAAFDVLAALDAAGLIESGYMGYTYDYVGEGVLEELKAAQGCRAVPALLIGEDGSSAIIWFCCWKGWTAPSYQLLVDDATGLAVGGYIPSTHVPPEELYRRMERWQGFFQDYYGIEMTDIRDDVYDDGTARFSFFFDPEDGLGPCGLVVDMYFFEMDFSAYPQSLIAFGRVDLEPVLPGQEAGSSFEVTVNGNKAAR